MLVNKTHKSRCCECYAKEKLNVEQTMLVRLRKSFLFTQLYIFICLIFILFLL